MRRHPVPNLSILGGFGKMVKLSQGAIDLHSARRRWFDALAALACRFGMDRDAVARQFRARGLADGKDDQRSRLPRLWRLGRADSSCASTAPGKVEVVVISRDGRLGRAGTIGNGGA